MLWLYVHFPQLQLDALLESSLQAKGSGSDYEGGAYAERALIVFDAQQNRVLQCNAVARAASIVVGMGLGTAASLCPNLEVIDYRYEAEERRLEELAQWLYGWTAEIVLFPPDGLALRVSPMLSLYESVEHYQLAMTQALDAQKVAHLQAFAHTPLAARLFARVGIQNEASDESQFMTILASLAVSQLELSERQVLSLQRVGVRQFKQLLAFPREELGQRFGVELLQYLEQVLGEGKSPYSFFVPPPYFEMNAPLTHEVENASALLFPSKVLFQKLEQYCQLRALYLASLQIRFIGRKGESISLDLVNAEPCYHAEVWLSLLQLKLENLRLEHYVLSISISASQWVSAERQQNDLFQARSNALSAGQVISRLEAKLGSGCVHRLAVQNDHRPEQSVRYLSVNQGLSVNKGQSPSQAPSSTRSSSNKNKSEKSLSATHSNNRKSSLRPSLLLAAPQALTETVQIIHGPERIEGAWWDEGQAICRDYFVALSSTEERLWVFRDKEQQWFVHGYFS